MTRMIALLILIIVAWSLLARAMRRLGSSPLGQLFSTMLGSRPPDAARRTPGGAVRLVACDTCGVHVPVDRAIATPGGSGYLCAACSHPSDG